MATKGKSKYQTGGKHTAKEISLQEARKLLGKVSASDEKARARAVAVYDADNPNTSVALSLVLLP